MTELTDKELAIKVAERLGDELRVGALGSGFLHTPKPVTGMSFWVQAVDTYLHDTAARVLFAMPDKDGVNRMPERITDAVILQHKGFSDSHTPKIALNWWSKITPRKVLEVFIELEGV
jgi:hypothetical protein